MELGYALAFAGPDAVHDARSFSFTIGAALNFEVAQYLLAVYSPSPQSTQATRVTLVYSVKYEPKWLHDVE